MDRKAYEHLAELNRNVEGALATLQKLAEYPELTDEDFAVRQPYLREHLANANLTVLSALDNSEQAWMLSANRERRAYEKKLRDPDDCYLEVTAREEERREQGLPSRIGILPGMSAAAHEEILDFSIEESDDQGMAPARSQRKTKENAMVRPEDQEFRRRLIARVDALRKEVRMSRLVFYEQIGPVAAKRWARFASACDEEAWNYFPLKQIDSIAGIFGIGGADLLRFKS